MGQLIIQKYDCPADNSLHVVYACVSVTLQQVHSNVD